VDLHGNRTRALRREGMSTYGIETLGMTTYGGRRVFSGTHDTRKAKRRSEPPFYKFLRELESGERT
jgi:hypothetical protein